MPDAYLLESFIGGLKPTNKSMVRAFKPLTLDQAIEQARCQEERLQSLRLPPDRTFRTTFVNSKPLLPTPPSNLRFPQISPSKSPQNIPATSKFPGPNAVKPTRFIPATERAEKMAKGLCFLCDQPYERV